MQVTRGTANVLVVYSGVVVFVCSKGSLVVFLPNNGDLALKSSELGYILFFCTGVPRLPGI